VQYEIVKRFLPIYKLLKIVRKIFLSNISAITRLQNGVIQCAMITVEEYDR